MAILVFFVALILPFAVYSAAPAFVIDLANSAVSMPQKIAVQVCAGHMNRDSNLPSVYTLLNQPYDSQWLRDIEGIDNPTLTDINTFIDTCLKIVKVWKF